MFAVHQLLEVCGRILTEPRKWEVHLPTDALGEIKECLSHFMVIVALVLLLQIDFAIGKLPFHSRWQNQGW